MKQPRYEMPSKKRSYTNLIIVLIGILIIMLTGFAYAAKLQDVENFASCWFSNTQIISATLFS